MLGPGKKKMKLSSDQSLPPIFYGVVSNQKHHQSLSRRWEELDVDCLANVFAKVGMESLLLALPFVCKSWYATTHNPLCWKSLSFPEFKPYPLFTETYKIEHKTLKFGPFYDKFIEQYRIHRTRFSITGFIKLVINRTNGKATYLKLPGFCTEEALRYVSNACPDIRMLYLCDDIELFRHSRIISDLIEKWKYLEHLTLGGTSGEILKQFPGSGSHLSKDFAELLSFKNSKNEALHKILVQVGMNCKHFRSLHICDALVGEDEVLAIVTMLPQLRRLTLSHSHIEEDTLVKLLQGCKKLCSFNLWHCKGFDEFGDELLKLAFCVNEFCYKGPPFDLSRMNGLKGVILIMSLKYQIWKKGRNILAERFQ